MRLTIYPVWLWTETRYGPHLEFMLSSIFVVKRLVKNYRRSEFFSIFPQVLRVLNPLGTSLSFIMIFGSQLLALEERGEHLHIWNASNGGRPPQQLIFNLN